MNSPVYDAYQSGGEKWLGEVPAHWKLRPLGFHFAERKTTVSADDYAPLSVTKDGIVPQLDTAAKTDNPDNRKLVLAGDFVINSRSDRKGSAGVSDQDGSVSVISTVLKLRAIEAGFVHHLLRSQAFQEEYYRFGSGIVADLWSTRYSGMRQITLAVPPRHEQRVIAEFLDRETAKIDALIGKQEQLIATLREDRAATINQAVTKGLESNVETKASGVTWLGEIPTHWIAARLKNVISAIDSGTSVNGADVPALPGEPGVLKTSCVSTGQFRPEANKTVFGEEVDRLSCPVTVGTLLVNRANTPALVGSAGFVHDPHPNLYLSDKIWQVSFTDSLAEFIYFWTQTNVYRSQITGNSVGASSSMQNLSMSDFKNTAIALPPISDQRAIVQFLSVRIRKIDALIDKSTEMIEMLREYRSALITNAVTGKIDVREAV